MRHKMFLAAIGRPHTDSGDRPAPGCGTVASPIAGFSTDTGAADTCGEITAGRRANTRRQRQSATRWTRPSHGPVHRAYPSSRPRHRVEIQQLERTFNLPQPFLPHMQVTGGGVQARMAQQPLHHRDLHAAFQQMRRKGMPQTVNPTLTGQGSARATAPVEKSSWPVASTHRAAAHREAPEITSRPLAETTSSRVAALPAVAATTTCNDPSSLCPAPPGFDAGRSADPPPGDDTLASPSRSPPPYTVIKKARSRGCTQPIVKSRSSCSTLKTCARTNGLAPKGGRPAHLLPNPDAPHVDKKTKGVDRLVDRTGRPLPLHRQVHQIGVDFFLSQGIR